MNFLFWLKQAKAKYFMTGRLPSYHWIQKILTMKIQRAYRELSINLPNIMPVVIVQATISLAFAILAEAGLSFLGLGTQPPEASWGLMIQASRDYLDRAPWTALVPGTAVALTVLGLNMFGDVLRDVLDPRSQS